jgi:hypothetical protein
VLPADVTPLIEIAGVPGLHGRKAPLLFEPQVILTVDGVRGDYSSRSDTRHPKIRGLLALWRSPAGFK